MGIAEQHAVTFAAGLAAAGMIPVVAVYSSFLQRAYDQILHDVCIQNLHVIFVVDRSGLVGADGSTHQGIFDITYLSGIPNMTVLSPKNRYELEDAMDFAVNYPGPIAIRYPRGTASDRWAENREPIVYGESECLEKGEQIAILAVGNMLEEAEKAYECLKAAGVQPTLVNARFVKPLDKQLIDRLTENHSLICTMEENVSSGGYGEAVAAYLMEQHKDTHFYGVAIPDQFVEQGSIPQLRSMLKMDGVQVAEEIQERLRNEAAT